MIKTKTNTMKKLPQLTIFFPCYNDAGTIGKMVKEALRIGKTITDDLEIIVVDDGSKDESPKILKELSSSIPELRVIYHKKNSGYGSALRDGFYSATKNFIFYTDGDAQYSVEELALLVEKMQDGVDLVNGYKLNRSDAWYRKLIGKLYSYGMGFLFGINVIDIDCDFRLFRRELLKDIRLESDSGAICVEMLFKFQKKGAVFTQVGVHHYPREYGRSQFFSFKHISKAVLGLIKLWWNLMVNKKWN